MKIQLLNKTASFEAKKQPVKNQASQVNQQENPAQKPLSFMSIPSMAFMGKLVVPNLPKGINPDVKPTIQKTSNLQELDSQPTVEYKVYPQDPLITKTENYTLKGEVLAGPENKRIKSEAPGELAKPDAKGNFTQYDPETVQFERVNSFTFVNKVLNMYENELGRKITWAFKTEQLGVLPRAGEDMNAYYSRWDKHIGLYHYKNPQNPTETCYTSKMADVITHEAGHATLDGLKPGWLGWGGAGGAVHEGFSDTTAMLVAMQSDTVLDMVLDQTKGNLKKENYIAWLAEQFGKSYYGNKMYLRNAINDLKGSDYETGRQSKQVHNYGRLMAGTLYDVMVEMAQANGIDKNPKEALYKTRAELTTLVARAMGDFAPTGNVFFNDIGKALLQADKSCLGGKYNAILQKVLLAREINTPAEIKTWEASQNSVPDLTLPPNSMDTPVELAKMVNDNKEKLGLPADVNFKLESAYNNTYGETFLQMKAERPVKFKYEGETYTINMLDGATLGFNKAGKLFYVGVNNTTQPEIDDSIWDAKNELGKIKAMQSKGLPITNPGVYKLPGSKDNVLIKVPKLEDPIGK